MSGTHLGWAWPGQAPILRGHGDGVMDADHSFMCYLADSDMRTTLSLPPRMIASEMPPRDLKLDDRRQDVSAPRMVGQDRMIPGIVRQNQNGTI